MAHRLYNIPLDETKRDREICIIHDICHNNGYPRHLINNIINKHKNNAQKHAVREKRKINYRKMEFHNETNNIINTIFRKHDYKLAFSTNNNVINKLKKQAGKHKNRRYPSG